MVEALSSLNKIAPSSFRSESQVSSKTNSCKAYRKTFAVQVLSASKEDPSSQSCMMPHNTATLKESRACC